MDALMLGSCIAHRINPRAYMHTVAELLVQGWPNARLRELLPDRIRTLYPRWRRCIRDPCPHDRNASTRCGAVASMAQAWRQGGRRTRPLDGLRRTRMRPRERSPLRRAPLHLQGCSEIARWTGPTRAVYPEFSRLHDGAGRGLTLDRRALRRPLDYHLTDAPAKAGRQGPSNVVEPCHAAVAGSIRALERRMSDRQWTRS
jgi:hypothetical protein